MKTLSEELGHREHEAPPANETRAEKAARIRAALQPFRHLQISTEEFLREKHAELAREPVHEAD